MLVDRGVPGTVERIVDARGSGRKFGFLTLDLSVLHPRTGRIYSKAHYPRADIPPKGTRVRVHLERSWMPKNQNDVPVADSLVAEGADELVAHGEQLWTDAVAIAHGQLSHDLEAAIQEATEAKEAARAAETEAHRAKAANDEALEADRARLNDYFYEQLAEVTRREATASKTEAAINLARRDMQADLALLREYGLATEVPPEARGPATLPNGPLLPLLEDGLDAMGLDYPRSVLRRAALAALLGFHTGSLLLLTGPTGTGKSTLAKVLWEMMGASPLVIPVRPGWLDATDLLGYLDSREDRFVATPFLRFVRDARELKGRPAPVILDELNLARIENYGADLLSQLGESRSGDGWLSLYPDDRVKELRQAIDDGSAQAEMRLKRLMQYPPELRLAEGLVVLGTLNDDETTKRLSPKVLDRSDVVRVERSMTVEIDWGARTHEPLRAVWECPGGEELSDLLEHTETEALEHAWLSAQPVLDALSSLATPSHRTLSAIRLLPRLAAIVGVSVTDALDDLLVARILPPITFVRGFDKQKTESLGTAAEAAGDSGFRGVAETIARELSRDDQMVSFLR